MELRSVSLESLIDLYGQKCAATAWADAKSEHGHDGSEHRRDAIKSEKEAGRIRSEIRKRLNGG